MDNIILTHISEKSIAGKKYPLKRPLCQRRLAFPQEMTGGFCINYRPSLIGWNYNPSVTFGDTSLYTREA